MATLKFFCVVLFGLSLLASWLNSAAHVLFGDMPLDHGYVTRGGKLPAGAPLVGVGTATLAFVALVGAFCLDRHRIAAGIAMLAMMAVIRQLEIRVWNHEVVVGLGKYVPAAAALLGYVVAQGAVALGSFDLDLDQAGWDGACGVLAGCWTLAAIAKLRESGVAWAGRRHTTLLIQERSYVGHPVLRSVRRRAARVPLVCFAAANAGLWGELMGFGFVVPELRWPIAFALTGFQAGIWLLLGYVETEWMVIMLALAGASMGAAPAFG